MRANILLSKYRRKQAGQASGKVSQTGSSLNMIRKKSTWFLQTAKASSGSGTFRKNSESHRIEIKGNFGESGTWQPSWHPEGDFLALPGSSNVKVVKRGSWSAAYFLGGEGKKCPRRHSDIIFAQWTVLSECSMQTVASMYGM